MTLALALLSILIPADAEAFSELARHGYVNCTACHLSPSGSGALTLYGRELSKELVATWAKDGEQNFAYGFVTPPEAVLLSGYLRGLQLHRDSATSRNGYPILMQADLEAAYNAEKWAVAITAGRQEVGRQPKAEGRIMSRRHYALYRVSDEHALRVGKFQKFFGLNDPNHNLYVRRRLGFQQDTETYNFEYSWLGYKFSTYATYIAGSLSDSKSSAKEDGASFSTSYFLGDKHKLGASYFFGDENTTRNDTNRHVFGPWFIIAWTDHLFSLSELDLQSKRNRRTGVKTSGYVTSNRLSYELFKGVLPFMLFEEEHLDRDQALTKLRTYGGGLQFFPRPHLEISAAWQKERLFSAPDYSDLAWLMMNFYL